MGLFTGLLRGLGGLAVQRPAHGGGTGGPVLEAARRAEQALMSVELPGYDVDIVSAGLVERIRVSRDGRSVMVFMGYRKSDPGCSFCRFISQTAWAKIARDSIERLRAAGFRHIIIVDADLGGVLAEHREEG